jgi:integrase
MQFSARAAKALPPGDHIVVEGCAGLRLEATQSSKTWTYRYKSPVDSRMRQIRLGHWPAMGMPAAVIAWQEMKDRRDAGEDPSLQRKEKAVVRRADAYTVADLVEDYVTGHLQVARQVEGAKATAARLRRAVDSIGRMPAADVTRAHAFGVLDALAGKPVVARSVRAELGAAWALAHDAGRLADDVPNWWRQLSGRRLRSKGQLRDGEHKGTGKRVLSDDELVTLLREDLALLPLVARDVLTLYLWTCCRGVEIVQMHAGQISREADGLWWTLPAARTKVARFDSAMDLRVPLVGRALQVVERRLVEHPGGYLFPSESPGGHVRQAAIQSQVHYRQPYSQTKPEHERLRFKVSHWSPHDLRRTGRTLLAAMGCPSDVGEVILGHVLPGVEGVYNRHRFDAERREWLGRLAVRLESLDSSGPAG